jgi:hypothetical protein
MIDADCAEQSLARILKVRILGQTVLFEAAFGVGFLVHLSLPAFIGPGGGAEADERR